MVPLLAMEMAGSLSPSGRVSAVFVNVRLPAVVEANTQVAITAMTISRATTIRKRFLCMRSPSVGMGGALGGGGPPVFDCGTSCGNRHDGPSRAPVRWITHRSTKNQRPDES